jgi:hypothetical protein
MSTQRQSKKRSYSSFYKIYRRIRFVRHRRKALNRKLAKLRRDKAREQVEIQSKLKEFHSEEEQKNRLKRNAEREETRKIKKELKNELREKKLDEQRELMELSRLEKLRVKEARKKEKEERKKIIRMEARSSTRNFYSFVRSLSLSTFRQKINEFLGNSAQHKRFAIITFNSTTLYLLSYLAFFLLSQFITVIAASFFHYPVIVHYYEIYFNISPDAWYHDSVKTIFSSGPLINFVVGITFLIIYSNIRERTGAFKLFFLWGFLHAVNMLFGAMLIGTLFETGLGYVVSWMYIMDTGKVLYSIISIFLLVLAGLLTTRQFLISGNTYYNEINRSNRTSFIISQVFLPYVIGNAVLIILRQPRFIFYDSFIGFTMIVCILPVLFTYRSYNELYFEEDEKRPGIAWLTFIILSGVILLFRGVLGMGLHIG